MNLVYAGLRLVVYLGIALVVVVSVLGIAGLDEVDVESLQTSEAIPHQLSLYRFSLSIGLVGGIALFVAGMTMWLSGRDFIDDLHFVDAGIDAMVCDDTLVASIPLRTLDELGALVRSFEELRRDFGEVLERERQLRKKLEQADMVKAEFLQAVSHELRTPLNAILGFADVLLDEIDGPLTEPQREDLQIIRNAGKHLMALFNDVLDLSAAATDQLRLKRVRVEIRPMLEEVAREIRGLLRDKQVEISVVVDPETPALDADPKRLRQILTNLASNAMKFTNKGEVRLEAKKDSSSEKVLLRVIDSGIGIPEKEIETIFMEFGQVLEKQMGKKSRKMRSGAGLGLTITKRLVELHGGTIHVASKVGEGSCFEVRLPARYKDGEQSPARNSFEMWLAPAGER